MKINILGTGCSKCQALFEVTKEAATRSNKVVQINKVEDIVDIMSYGVTSTPALAIDKEVKVSGRVPSVDEVVQILNNV